MRNICTFLSVTTSLLFFISCNNKSKELVTAIPANATSVIIIDGQSIIRKSEYDIFKNPKISQLISLVSKGMSDAQKKQLSDFMNDANSLGVNVKGDLFVYTDSTKLGVVLQVLDSKTLESSFIKSGFIKKEDIKQEDDLHIISILYPNLVIGWDSNRLLLLKDLNAGDSTLSKDDLINYLKVSLSQSEEKSIASNTQFQQFLAKKKDVSLYSNLNQITNNSEIDIRIPQEFKNIELASYINFEKGEIVSSSQFLYPSAEIEKQFIEKGHAVLGTLKGEQLAYIPDSTVFTVSANIKGRELINILNSYNFFDNTRNDNMLLKTFIANIDGDVTFSVLPQIAQETNWVDSKEAEPRIVLLAEVANAQNLFDTFISFIQEMNDVKVMKNDSGSYTIVLPYTSEIYIRVKGNLVSITNSENADLRIKDDIKTGSSYTSYAKEKSVVLFGTTDNIYKQVVDTRFELYSPSAYRFGSSLVSLLNDYRFSIKSDNFSGQGSIFLKDHEQNSLKTFSIRLDKALQDLISLFF